MKKIPESILTYKITCLPKAEILEIARFFGFKLPSSLKKAELADRLMMAIRTDPLRCLERLPLYELEILQLLISKGKGEDLLANAPVPILFLMQFGFVVDCYEPDEFPENRWEEMIQIYLEDEAYDLFAPVIDIAVSDVNCSGRLEYERFLWGCLTIYGYLSIDEFKDIWRICYPDRDEKGLLDFMESYPCFHYLLDGVSGHLYYPGLDCFGLYAEQRVRGTFEKQLLMYSLDDFLSAGKTTPFNFPFASHREGRALAEALKADGYGNDCVLIMHWLWYEIQTGEGDEARYKELVNNILQGMKEAGAKKANSLARAIESYSNVIPVWAFRGRSSMDMMCDSPALRGNEAMSSFFERQMAGLFRAAVVGPDDPCPCGSGLKYKNCHGKNRIS